MKQVLFAWIAIALACTGCSSNKSTEVESIDTFQVGLFVPMHFTMSGFESAWRMEPYCKEKHIPFWRIAYIGESISVP